MEGLEQQLSYLAKGVGDLEREEEASLEQSSRSNLDLMCDSNDCYEGNRFGARHGYNDRYYKRVPRNEVRNGGNYVKMEDRFHKRRENVKRYHDCYDHYEHSYSGGTYGENMCNEHNDSYSYGGYHKGLGQGQSKVKFMKSSMVEESTKVMELHNQKLNKVIKHMLWKRHPKRNLVIS
ncbi:hypothetical protein M9H77_31045 [Catharanthus roseus]|uniref:Uncharacterized protein n=1 Tax=Catharanthus roseus TaxID=4058 RepID=A0ACC0A387_CATRO|nr:hypothetical protein M9H77_31045 [Catharanthus roseus]